jgi:copper homeostasis protein (lipoprotein)
VLSRSLAALIVAGAALAACGRAAAPPPAPPAPPPLPRAANLPRVGHFAGILPCADCRGIRTELILAGDWEGLNRYHLTETYLGTSQGDRTVEREGAWTTLRGVPDDDNATVYQLDPDIAGARRHFLVVDERTLALLDDFLQPVGEPLTRVDGK